MRVGQRDQASGGTAVSPEPQLHGTKVQEYLRCLIEKVGAEIAVLQGLTRREKPGSLDTGWPQMREEPTDHHREVGEGGNWNDDIDVQAADRQTVGPALAKVRDLTRKERIELRLLCSGIEIEPAPSVTDPDSD